MGSGKTHLPTPTRWQLLCIFALLFVHFCSLSRMAGAGAILSAALKTP
jgi:hypothetical protein